MITTHKITPDIGVEGTLAGGDRETAARQLALTAQVDLLTVTAGAETDDLVITYVDDETGQSYSATAAGSATEATLLANALAAIRSSELDKLFSVTGSAPGNVLINFTARHANRSYTGSATGGTAVADPVFTTPTEAGGTGLEFGRFVARGAADGSFAAVGAASVVGDVLGMIFRTEANHFRPDFDADGPSAVDLCRVGKHIPVVKRGRIFVRVEDAVTPASVPYMRRAGTGRLGGLRATADGGNTIDVSSICEFESSAPADGLAILRIKK